MKFLSAFAWFLLSPGNNKRGSIGHPTGQNTPKSKVFCQESLTELTRRVENKADITLCNMAFGKIGTGLAALGAMAAITTVPEKASAEDIRAAEVVDPIVLATAGQTVRSVEECKAARRAGELDRAGFRECKRTAVGAEIAEQERVLADLREQLAQYGLRLNQQAQILDEGGRVLAQIVAINGKLILREESEARTVAALDRIKAFLEANS